MGTKLQTFFLFSLGALPFLVPLRSDPIPSFYAEWLAALLGLGFVISEFIFRSSQDRTCYIPRLFLAMIPLAVIILIQFAIGLIGYREQVLLVILYLIWALLIMAAAASFSARNGISSTSTILAWSFTFAAVTGAAITIATQGGLFSNSARNGMLGQVNHFGHLLWLGIAGVVFLTLAKRLAKLYAVSVLILLFVMSASTASRSTLMYSAWIGCVLAVSLHGRWKLLAPGFVAAYGFTVWIVAKLVQLTPNINSTGVDRTLAQRIVFEASPDDSIRLKLWQEAWELFLQHPWLGSGWGSFRFWTYLTGNREGAWTGGAEHSHNLLMNLLAETGVLVTLCIVFLLVKWFFDLWRERRRPEIGFLFAVTGIGLTHSQVEYPFWYLYFLAVFLVALTAGDRVIIKLQFGKIAMGVVSLIALTTLLVIGRDYVMLEYFSRPLKGVTDEGFAEKRLHGFLNLSRTSIFAPEAEMALISLLPPTRENLETKLALCSRSIAYHPSLPGVFTCALLSELHGQHEEATMRWSLALAAGGSLTTAEYVKRQREFLSPDDLAPLERLLSTTSHQDIKQ